jgi:capsular exopolysaccharide synthesis family protein
VKPVDGTRLVEVQFTTPDPVLSQQLANAHASAFIQTTLETRFDLTKEAREFLGKKLGELKAKVQHAEDALNNFRQTRGVVSLEGNENIVIERMVDLNRRLTEATARRIELESLFRMTDKKDAQYLSQIIENPLIQQIKASLATQEAEQARFATMYTPAHPRSVELRMQMNQARRRLDSEIANVVRKIESDYASARAKETTLQEEAQRQQQAALTFKELGAEFTFLKGEADSCRALYERVLKRLHETSIANEGSVSNMEISEPADIPLSPSSPKVGRDLLLLAFAGMLFGVGLAFFRNYSDSTVDTPEDVWRVASHPTLGVIPSQNSVRHWPYANPQLSKFPSLRRLTRVEVATNGSSSRELVTAHHPLSVLAECYRNICARLLFSQDEQSPQVILLTSAHPGDGKTVTTLNLAITLAQNGRKVVVVDADVRRGRCHALLRKKNHPGLTTVLAGEVPVQQALQETTVPGLSFLPRGVAAPSSPFSLGSPKVKELVDTLRQHFEFVLIDSPPAIAVSDAVLLARLCDGVLLVVHGQRTTEDSVRRLVAELETVRAPILGVVLNGVDFDSPEYVEYRRYAESADVTAPAETNGRARGAAQEGSAQP